MKLVNSSNPVALGVDWTDDETGTQYELCVPRGTDSVWFGMRSADVSEWSTVPVTNPERFGRVPRTVREMIKYAQVFIAWDNERRGAL